MIAPEFVLQLYRQYTYRTTASSQFLNVLAEFPLASGLVTSCNTRLFGDHTGTRWLTSILGLNGAEIDLRTSEVLPSVEDPGDDTNKTDDADSGTAVIHVVGGHWTFRGEIEVDSGEEQEDQTDTIQDETPFAQGKGAGDDLGVLVAGEPTPEAHEQGHGIGDVEAESGNGDDGGETFVAGEVDAVQGHLDQQAENDAVDGDLGLLVDFGEEAAEGEAVVSRESPQGTTTLSHQAVGADENDDGDQRSQGGGAFDATGAVVEDLDERDTGGGVGGGFEIADAEEGGDQEDEAGDGAEPDGHDDGLGRFFGRVDHLFGHVRGGVVAAHAEQGVQQAQHDGHASRRKTRVVLEVLEDEAGGLFVVVAGEDGNDDDEEADDVPDDGEGGDGVQVARQEDVDARGEDGHQVGDQDALPSLDFVVWVIEVGHAEEEVGSDLDSRVSFRCCCWRGEKGQGGRVRRVLTKLLTAPIATIPVHINQPVTQAAPRAYLGGARMATQLYCPPAVG